MNVCLVRPEDQQLILEVAIWQQFSAHTGVGEITAKYLERQDSKLQKLCFFVAVWEKEEEKNPKTQTPTQNKKKNHKKKNQTNPKPQNPTKTRKNKPKKRNTCLSGKAFKHIRL